jgi:hypothetical protein
LSAVNSIGSLLIENRRIISNDGALLEGADENLTYLPQTDKFEIVKTVNSKNWYKDDFFVNELFNGCNPVSIRVVNMDNIENEIHAEFFNLDGFNPKDIK